MDLWFVISPKVSAQRRHYKILTNEMEGTTPMTMKRAKKLVEIGFEWTSYDPRHVSWEERFKQLCDFKAKYGHALVPMGYEENPSLAHWVSAQVSPLFILLIWF